MAKSKNVIIRGQMVEGEQMGGVIVAATTPNLESVLSASHIN